MGGRHRQGGLMSAVTSAPLPTQLLRGAALAAALTVGTVAVQSPMNISTAVADMVGPRSTDTPVPPQAALPLPPTPAPSTPTAAVDKDGLPVVSTVVPRRVADPVPAPAATGAPRAAARTAAAAAARTVSTPERFAAPAPTPAARPRVAVSTPTKLAPRLPATPAARPSIPAAPVAGGVGARIASNAAALAGGKRIPYVWGGKVATGLDCSGLVWEVLKRAGLSVPYRSSGELKAWATPVPAGSERPGDLAFYPGHVMIVVAPGMVADASDTLNDVTVRPYWGSFTFGRVKT
jgi:cell wall-associated NlpC family hydrolase